MTKGNCEHGVPLGLPCVICAREKGEMPGLMMRGVELDYTGEMIKPEEQNIIAVIKAAREIQEFLWGEMNRDCGLEEFKRMFRKRVAKIDAVSMDNPHWKIELKKRLLQTAAISVNVLTKLDNDMITHGGTHPTLPSNLPEFYGPVHDK